MEDGIEVKVKIYDTDDQECFKNITWIYIKLAEGVIINFDITQSFYGVVDWINRIKNDSSLKEKVLYIVGNKNDLEDKRVISKEEGEKLAKKYRVMFSECSAKAGENVDFIFNEIIKKCYKEIKAKKNLKTLNKYISF